jgi:arsenate reductase (glutaredoxin)
MPAVTLYHNPRCSKSRKTLELLEEHGVHPKIVLYLETPLTREEITGLLRKLGLTAGELVRRGEDEYKVSGLNKGSSDEEILAAMTKYPKLLERPIVVRGARAVVGRPPEKVLELLDS